MPHPYQLTTPSLRDWYCHPHGADYPSAIASAASNHTTFHMTFYDSRITQFYIIRARCYIESQLPRLHIGPDFSANGEVIFTAQHTFDFALEVENSPLSLIYHHHRRACPLLFYSRGCQDTLTHWKQVSLVTIRVNVPPIVLGFLPLDPQRGQAQDTDDAWEALTSAAPGQTICLWTSVGPAQGRGLEEVWSLMKELVPLARQTEGSFWYRELHKPDREGCRPTPPWLVFPNQRDRVTMLYPAIPAFLDQRDRLCRLLDALYLERREQRRVFGRLLQFRIPHVASSIEFLAANLFRVHVNIMNMSTPPVVPEMTKVFFSFKVPGNSLEAFRQTSFVGTVVEDDSICDFTIACRGAVPKRLLDFSPFVFLSLEGVTSPLEKQTVALEKTAQPLVEGDLAERFKVGFSLLRTVLSHGVEMNPESPLCFELSIKDLSPLPPKEASSRLQMVQKFFEDKLDKSQRKAVRLSVERLRGGLSIIVGPPGTGKTLTAIPVIVSAMALEVPVLLTAATNKAVGNVLAALMNFLQRYPCIGSLCGLAMRLRAVDEELATLRGHGTAERPVDATIQQAEAYNLVVKYATMEKDRSSDCRRLIELLDMDLKFGVSGPPLSELKRLYKSTLGRVIGKARLIAATLIESGAEILKTSKFKPALMICDEASQASEPEMMIPMTLKSFRGLVLIGDPNQLEPTVLSINGKNEHALFLKRSLLKRLVDAKYPLAQLQTDYRNHPQIMEFFNRRVYLNTLNVGAHKSIPLNNERARVGQVFDSFMESYVARAEHCHIPKSEVARLKRTVPGRRRLWLKIQSYAKREISGQSWENKPQVTALKTFLLQLYRYQYKGMSITPDDVMVLCPYRAQQEICRLELQLDANLAGEIIPVDAAQGREAPMTILMLTTPGRGDFEDLGIVNSEARLNMALSRAQQVCLIVGNMDMFTLYARKRIRNNGKGSYFLEVLADIKSRQSWFYPLTSRYVTREPATPAPGVQRAVRKDAPKPVDPVVRMKNELRALETEEYRFVKRKEKVLKDLDSEENALTRKMAELNEKIAASIAAGQP